jgi:serine beta-lactamase-like protein LACTB
MLKSRTETWLAVAVLGIGLIPVAILGLWGYMSATATPLHPVQNDVPSTTRGVPLPQWSDAVEQSRQVVRAGLSEENVPGLSVAVGVDGNVVWAEGFGWADLEKRVPVAPEMTFRIGTASTVLTSAAVGLLVEKGRLKLDEAIQTYVPAFVQTYAPAVLDTQWSVTLRQLMGHTAGIPNDGGDEGALFSQHCERPIDALQFFSGYERELRFEPGTRYQYSNYGWIVVSAAIEAAASEPFLTFMQERVFEPLGMHDTTPDSTLAPTANQVTSYFPRFAADPNYGPDVMRPLDYSCYAGSSVFLSTPSDLVRFGMAINSGEMLQPTTVRMLQTPQRLSSGQETGYGLGWDLEPVTLAGERTHWVGHNGLSLGGTVSSFMTYPERGLVVSVLSNISYTDTPGLALKIAQAFAAVQGRNPSRK